MTSKTTTTIRLTTVPLCFRITIFPIDRRCHFQQISGVIFDRFSGAIFNRFSGAIFNRFSGAILNGYSGAIFNRYSGDSTIC